MNLSDLISYAMRVSGTPARTVAAALGLSPQNFGQRLRRDGFDLEETRTAIYACGCDINISVSFGSVRFDVS